MLIITGPGRSGTSVLARFCESLGYQPGGEWCDEIDAGLEHPRVAAINDAMFREARTTGRIVDALAANRAEIASLDLQVIKDPRFTYHPLILRSWRQVRPDLTVLLTYRNPELSIASRKRHREHLFIKHKARPETLKCDLADSIEVLLDCEIPHAMLLFPNFLKQYDRVHRTLTDLGLSFSEREGRAEWDRIVDEKRVHFRTGGDGASTAPAVGREVSRSEGMLRAALGPLKALACTCTLIASVQAKSTARSEPIDKQVSEVKIRGIHEKTGIH